MKTTSNIIPASLCLCVTACGVVGAGAGLKQSRERQRAVFTNDPLILAPRSSHFFRIALVISLKDFKGEGACERSTISALRFALSCILTANQQAKVQKTQGIEQKCRQHKTWNKSAEKSKPNNSLAGRTVGAQSSQTQPPAQNELAIEASWLALTDLLKKKVG